MNLLITKARTSVLALGVLTAVFAAGCNSKPTELAKGNAKVSVNFSSAAAVIADVARIDVDISGGNPAMTAFTVTLTKASNGTQWTGNITGIPAGTGRIFHAAAFKADNTKIYEGSTTADITAGGTATIIIVLQESNPAGGPTNFAPVISAVSSSDSIVPAGTSITLSFVAFDPDNNYPLTYNWGSSCTGTGGNGAFDVTTGSLPAPVAPATTVGATAHWTAPGTNGVLCTLSIKVTDSNNIQGPSSVTTFLTIQVQQTTGSANVTAFPNSFPVVTQFRGDFAYNFDSTATTPVGGVGQIGSLFTTAIDPDGDDIRYDYTAVCNDGPLPPQPTQSTQTTHLSFATLTGATGTPSNPTWALPDAAASCVFTVVVHDLCTNNDCGADQPVGTPGRLANGADRGGATTGILNATAPAKPQEAPFITRTVAPNVSGTGGATVVDPSTDYTFAFAATDPAGGNLTVVWSATTGTVGAPSNSGNLTSAVLYHSPATLQAAMSLTAQVTSSVSGLSTTVTFNLVGSDPCVSLPDGTACGAGNLCLTGQTCHAGVCGGGTPTVCSGATSCENNVCNPNTGCGTTNKPDGTTCDDGNACTGVPGNGDSCHAGVCAGGGAVVCAAAAQCFVQGACVPASGCPAPAPAPSGTTCNDGNLCTQTDACDAAGNCVGSNPVNCAGGQCTTGGTCNPATGTCQGGTNQPNGTPCNDGNACTTGDQCQGGVCTGTPLCPAGETCNPTGPVCVATVPNPQKGRDLQVSPPSGIAMDTSGNTFVASAFFSITPISFDGISLTSTGDADIFLARYNPGGTADWAIDVGDSGGAPQLATGISVTQNGTVAAIGNFSGSISFGSSTINSANQIDFLAAVSASNGAGMWAKQFNDGANGLLASVAASPTASSNRIAVCGHASQAATDLVPGAVFGGGNSDLIIGVFDSTGTRLWSFQIGGTGNEECDAVAIDDAGDVYAAGKFDGASLTFPPLPPLTGPNTTSRKFLWVAKFNGATGAAVEAAVFSGTAGQVAPNGIAVDASGNTVVAGNFTGTALTFGGGTPLSSAGGQDVFVAKLDTTLTAVWSQRMGGTGPDSASGVAVNSSGEVLVTGGFQRTTTGVAVLTAAGVASDIFLLKLNSTTGASQFAANYGDVATQTGDAISVNRSGTGAVKDTFSLAGTLNGSATFPAPVGTVTAVGSTDTLLIIGSEN